MALNFPRSNVLELELTSKCTLKCYCCPRTKQADDRERWDNGHLDVDKLLSVIDDKVTKLDFAGAFGDGIYNPDAYKVIEFCKDKDIDFNFETNGSYVKDETWHKIAQAIPDPVQQRPANIVFSIDGPPDNFTKYRVNGDWDSIERGIRILTSAGKSTRWKYIIFKYNSSFEDIKKAYDKAWELGMRQFMLVNTKRAEPGQLISQEDFADALDSIEEYYETIKHLNPPFLRIQIHPRVRKVTEEKTIKKNFKKSNIAKSKYNNLVREQRQKYETESTFPQCINVDNWTQFIGSNGIYYPCCYVRAEDDKMIKDAGLTEEDLESMSIYKHSIEEIITGIGYRKIMNNFENIRVCKNKCPKKKV